MIKGNTITSGDWIFYNKYFTINHIYHRKQAAGEVLSTHFQFLTIVEMDFKICLETLENVVGQFQLDKVITSNTYFDKGTDTNSVYMNS